MSMFFFFALFHTYSFFMPPVLHALITPRIQAATARREAALFALRWYCFFFILLRSFVSFPSSICRSLPFFSDSASFFFPVSLAPNDGCGQFPNEDSELRFRFYVFSLGLLPFFFSFDFFIKAFGAVPRKSSRASLVSFTIRNRGRARTSRKTRAAGTCS